MYETVKKEPVRTELVTHLAAALDAHLQNPCLSHLFCPDMSNAGFKPMPFSVCTPSSPLHPAFATYFRWFLGSSG